MPRKPEDLQSAVAKLMTVEEAAEWTGQHLEELKLAEPVKLDTLKKACARGRLKAVLKGRIYLTREVELRQYLSKFDPKNKTERTPVGERALKRRAAKTLNQQ